MNKKILIGMIGIVLMTTMVSAYTTYKVIETSYLTVTEEATINKLMVEENLVMPPGSHFRMDGTLHLAQGWSGACDDVLRVQDGIVVGCGASK